MAPKVDTVRGPQATIRFDAGPVHTLAPLRARPPRRVRAQYRGRMDPPRARHDGKPDEAPPLVNTARLRGHGPLAIHAELALPDGERRLRATLCRCGASANKPYCDGSHKRVGFRSG